MNNSKSKHPHWAIKHKRKGTELRLINGKYYLYEVTSKWDPIKKRPRKITGKLLGRITPEGFIESKKRIAERKTTIKNVSVKEYGATQFLYNQMNDIIEHLKKIFPNNYMQIVAYSFINFLYNSPLKNIFFYFENSYLSNMFKNISLSDKMLTKLLKEIGSNREKIVEFLKLNINSKNRDSILIDATNFFSYSNNLELTKKGYNSKLEFEPQVNALFIYSSELKQPLYYRLVPGDIREVNAFELTLKESGLTDAIIISDKGFYSERNMKALEGSRMGYIIPLRRNNKIIDYSRIELERRSGFEGFFKHGERYIWYYSYESDKGRVYLFYDEELKYKEERDYLDRIEKYPEEYSMESFYKSYIRFGTLAILTKNIKLSAEEVYRKYKSRNEIEVMIKTIKKTLEVDASYMRDKESYEGWMFLNFLKLIYYYRIYNLLLKKKMLSKYSVKDVLMHMKEIRKVRINEEWYVAEVNTKTKKLIKKLDIDIPIT
jgi:transposase